MTDAPAETKGNVILKEQIPRLISGLKYWEGKDGSLWDNPLWESGLDYLAFKLQVLGRLRLYAQVELAGQQRMNLLYVGSGSDEFCRVIESFGLEVTTIDMNDNAYSRRHIKRTLMNDEASRVLLREHIAATDFILWDTSIGHLDQRLLQDTFKMLSGKAYLLGLYDVPKLALFGPKIRGNVMMSNIIETSPTVNPRLYEQVLQGCSLRCTVDLGAFSLLLYDNIFDFPFNDVTVSRALAAANSG